MKKIGLLILVASLGGIVAVGVTKLIDKKENHVILQNHLAKYASLSESGNRPDFVEVADLVTPTVVHIITQIDPTQSNREY